MCVGRLCLRKDGGCLLLLPQDQWLIRAELRSRFPEKPWLDVLSKSDMLAEELAAADARIAAAGAGGGGDDVPAGVEDAVDYAAALPAAVRASSITRSGIPELKVAVMRMLEEAAAAERAEAEERALAEAALGGAASGTSVPNVGPVFSS